MEPRNILFWFTFSCLIKFAPKGSIGRKAYFVYPSSHGPFLKEAQAETEAEAMGDSLLACSSLLAQLGLSA